jgi:hypothetical protein
LFKKLHSLLFHSYRHYMAFIIFYQNYFLPQHLSGHSIFKYFLQQFGELIFSTKIKTIWWIDCVLNNDLCRLSHKTNRPPNNVLSWVTAWILVWGGLSIGVSFNFLVKLLNLCAKYFSLLWIFRVSNWNFLRVFKLLEILIHYKKITDLLRNKL